MDVRGVYAAASARLLAEDGVEEGRMLQSPGLRADGRFFAFCTGEDVVVKLPEERVTELIESGLGGPCAPRPGRPMREWVRLIPGDEDACAAYLAEAHAFVAGG